MSAVVSSLSDLEAGSGPRLSLKLVETPDSLYPKQEIEDGTLFSILVYSDKTGQLSNFFLLNR